MTTQDKLKYSRLRKEFLIKNPLCALNRILGFNVKATHVHHKRGRKGDYYLDTRYWIAVTKESDKWIHSNVEKAKKFGLIE